MGIELSWKDEKGVRLCEGDTLMLEEPGMDVLGKVEFVPDMGRYMLAVTHLRYKACGDRWHPVPNHTRSWRNLIERGHYLFTRRLRGVYLVERVDAERLGVDRADGYAPLPLITGRGWVHPGRARACWTLKRPMIASKSNRKAVARKC